jgi:general secretion pathway protein I
MRNHTFGFTLLEAMVAMLLIATVGMAVFDWINSSLDTLLRLQEHHLREQAVRNALSFMETVNPMEKPRGETVMGECIIRWDSQLTEPEKDGVGHPAGVSLYRLGLYHTHIKIETNGNQIAELVLHQVGYRQAREFKVNF